MMLSLLKSIGIGLALLGIVICLIGMISELRKGNHDDDK